MNRSAKYTIAGLGEILWDIYDDKKFLGGAPANFALHVQRLGHEGLVLSRVGNDPEGYESEDHGRDRIPRTGDRAPQYHPHRHEQVAPGDDLQEIGADAHDLRIPVKDQHEIGRKKEEDGRGRHHEDQIITDGGPGGGHRPVRLARSQVLPDQRP